MDFLPFILRRARRHWQLLLTLSLGVVLTTALLASGPLLVDTVVEMGLYRTLESSGAEGNLRLAATTRVDQAGFQTLDREIQVLVQTALGEHLDRVAWLVESPSMFRWAGGRLYERINLRYYDGIRDRVEYVAGEWPGRQALIPTSSGLSSATEWLARSACV